MKKNKHDLMERYIYLEEWLQDNYPSDMTDGEVLSYFMNNFTNKHDILYLKWIRQSIREIRTFLLAKTPSSSTRRAHRKGLYNRRSCRKRRICLSSKGKVKGEWAIQSTEDHKKTEESEQCKNV